MAKRLLLAVSLVAVLCAGLAAHQLIVGRRLEPPPVVAGGGGGGTPFPVTCSTTLASPAMTTLNSTMSSAADGDTVCVTGSVTGNSLASFPSGKNLTVAGAGCQTGGGTTTINVSATVFGNTNQPAGTDSALHRICGFTFSGNHSADIWWYSDQVETYITRIRIDHNVWTSKGASNIFIQFGQTSPGSNDHIYGVIDYNTYSGANDIQMIQMFGNKDFGTAESGTQGTSHNLFVENNTITITTPAPGSGLGCIDSQGQQGIVWRYNTTDGCLVASHGVTHAWGPVNFEFYNNTVKMTNYGTSDGFDQCYRCFHHQGSAEMILFNNVFTQFSGHGHSGTPISITHYRSADPVTAGYSIAGRCDGGDGNDGNRSGMQGYPCYRQPGRDPNGVLQPIFLWNNTWSDDGSFATMNIENPWGATSPSVADHVANDREYYQAVSASAQTTSSSPFDGTTGMGFGITSRRPTTCTTNPATSPNTADAGKGGVGYFDTDTNTLYMCTATNTWTARYQAYTYPHPDSSN